MPRSAAKSSADKNKRRLSVPVVAPPTQDLEEEYIIPGRFTKTQWMDVLIQEDADEVVGEIMDELMIRVMEGCLKVHIERQLPAYTASWAKSYLTQILEQRVMCLDEGDEPEEVSRTEDSEPMPTSSHAWAPGCVPIVNPTPPPHPISKEAVDIGQVPVQTKPRGEQQCNVMAQTNNSPKQSEKETSPRRPVRDKHYKVLSPRPSPKIDQKKKQQINLAPKPVPSKLLPPLSGSAEKRNVKVEGKDRTHSFSSHTSRSLYQQTYQSIPNFDPSCLPQHSIPIQYETLDNSNTKPSAKKPSELPKVGPRYNKQKTEQTVTSLKTVTRSNYQPEDFRWRDEADPRLKKLSPSIHPKYQSIPKLDPSCLPRRIPIQYEILDNDTKPSHKKPSGLSKLEPSYSKQQTEQTGTSLKPVTSSKDQPEDLRRRNEADLRLKKMSPFRHPKEEMVYTGPLRLDTMKLAKGVSLLEPQAVDINSFKLNPPGQSRNLRPIRSEPSVPLYSVEELTSGPSPRVRPLYQSN
ncbi:protein C2orf81-like protein [Nibea albiflora]|uniref:Protein C2orf81-like protein n=1 Tax=Nibea albiflora TaxID=240163 RepID=A0ACB7FD37_NIBAL|nr:protein C2orf81-like protein [Nibea albiflora]